MRAFADMVADPAAKEELMNLLMADYETSLQKIEKLMGGSVEERRISRLENIKLRKEALEILHRIQIRSLREWRKLKESKPEESDSLLWKLLLLVNALAGGLKSTG